MSNFDPYHKWLGIPPAEQPPHHYRLLGIALFETDPDVIEAAADRQMSYIRQCATGPYTKESQKLLNELSATRVCLLNVSKKQTYDKELSSRLAPAEPSQESQSTVSRPRVTRIPSDRLSPEAADDDEFSMILREQSFAEGAITLPRRRSSRKRTARPNPYWIWGAAGGLGLLLLWGFVHLVSRPGGEMKQAAADAAIAGKEVKPARKAANETTAATRRQAPDGETGAKDPDPGKTEPSVVTASPPAVESPRDIVERILRLKGNFAVRSETSPWIPIGVRQDLPEGDVVEIQHLELQLGTVADLQAICSLPIQYLTLSGEGFIDDHLAVLAKAKTINSLGLYKTSCTDSGLRHLARCPGLRAVQLMNQKFTPGGWKHLRQIAGLHEVDAKVCEVSDAHVASLAGHPQLKSLSLMACSVTGEGFRAFRGQPQLESVSLTHCQLDPAGVRAIAEGLPELKNFSAAYFSISGEGFEGLRNMKRLEMLHLEHDNGSGIEMGIVTSLGSLKHLDILDSDFTGASLRGQAGKLPNLQHCGLGRTRLTDEGLKHLAAAAPRIERLFLDSTAVTDECIDSLTGFTSLHLLNLMNTKISKQGLEQLKAVRGLEMLHLSKDRFTPAELDELRKTLPDCNIQVF